MMELYQYQKEGVTAIAKSKRFFLGDAQGIGKTAQAIRAAMECGCVNVLILCPKSLIGNWGAEIVKWGPAKKNPEFRIYNWDKLIDPAYLAQITSTQWDMIIGDECHKAIKSWNAERCRNFIHKVVPTTKRLLLMSGTPVTRSAEDLHPLLSVMEPGVWGKVIPFCEKYCNKVYHGRGKRGFSYTGFRNEGELNAALKRIGLRRTKEEVLPDLPPKIRTDIPVIVSPLLIAESLKIDINTVMEAMENGEPLDVHIASIMRSVGEAKCDSAIEFLSTFSSPVVVFAYHKAVFARLFEGLTKLGYAVAVITGDTPAEERSRSVEMFQAGKYDFIIGNITAMGTGHTLTRASHVVFVESVWDPAAMEQAEDRIHRIGQKNCANIYRLIAEGTIDEAVVNVLRNKKAGIARIMK